MPHRVNQRAKHGLYQRHIVIAVTALALLWIACFRLPVRAQDEPTLSSPTAPITLAEYRTELEQAITALEDVPANAADSLITDLQQRFAAITHVEYPSGEVVAMQSILADLETVSDGPGSPRQLALTRLRGIAAQLDATATDNTDARLRILNEVLQRPEFNTPLTLWDRLWRWLRDLLTDLLPAGRGGNSGWLVILLNIIPWLVAIAIIAAILWLLSYWLQRILRAFVTDARTLDLAVEGDLPATAAEARQQARTAAQSGNYRDAVRRLYLAALLQLAEHDLITYERSLTNREVLVRVPNDSPIRPHLEPVVATFDQVWYGVREPDLATFHAYEQEIDELATVARRAASTSAPASSRGVA